MPRVRLFHANPDEAAMVAGTLARGGFEVEYEPKHGSGLIREIRQSPPDAFVIDLSRLPSHGREIATFLRGARQTRSIPILFVDGVPEKVEIVRQKLPDAAYCERSRLLPALRKCIAHPVSNPVVPTQMMDRYAGRTTAQKLGIAAGSAVAVIDAPRDYARAIGPLPGGVEFHEEASGDCAVTIWFVEEPEALVAALPKMRRLAAGSRLWVAWPKKSSRKESLLNENIIREMALENGLVDYKVCSINPVWSGLCLAVKKARAG